MLLSISLTQQIKQLIPLRNYLYKKITLKRTAAIAQIFNTILLQLNECLLNCALHHNIQDYKQDYSTDRLQWYQYHVSNST